MATQNQINQFKQNWPIVPLPSNKIVVNATIPAAVVERATKGADPTSINAFTVTNNLMMLPNSSADRDDGAVGFWVEDELESEFFPINRGRGVDLCGFIEIKTRRLGTNAKTTVGSMSVLDICNYSWSNSDIARKMRAWLLVTWDIQSITMIQQLDFIKSDIQSKLESSYNEIRNQVEMQYVSNIKLAQKQILNNLPLTPMTYTNVKCSKHVFLAEAIGNTSYKFRLYPPALNSIIRMAISANMHGIIM